MALNACDIDFKSAAWGLRKEQRMKNRGFIGGWVLGASWTLLLLGELYDLCCTFIPPLSHTSLELMQAIWWHVIGSFYHISVRLAGSCHDLGWVDYLIGGLKCVKCVCVIWHAPVKLQTLRNIFPELGHLSEILKWLPLHGLEATQKQSLPLPVRGVLRQQRHMDSSGWRDARIYSKMSLKMSNARPDVYCLDCFASVCWTTPPAGSGKEMRGSRSSWLMWLVKRVSKICANHSKPER